MILNAQITQSEGKPTFAVIDFEEYQTIQQSLAAFDNLNDFVDYIHALNVKNEITVWHTLDNVKEELGL